MARYWVKVGKKKQLLSYDELQGASSKRLPSHGIVELLAQSGCLAWPELVQDTDFWAVQQKKLLFQPSFVAKNLAHTQICKYREGNKD